MADKTTDSKEIYDFIDNQIKDIEQIIRDNTRRIYVFYKYYKGLRDGLSIGKPITLPREITDPVLNLVESVISSYTKGDLSASQAWAALKEGLDLLKEDMSIYKF